MRFRQNRNDCRSSVLSFLFSLEAHSQYFINNIFFIATNTQNKYYYTQVACCNCSCDVTPQLTQGGAESGGECVTVVL